jgi:hypothetical protein
MGKSAVHVLFKLCLGLSGVGSVYQLGDNLFEWAGDSSHSNNDFALNKV